MVWFVVLLSLLGTYTFLMLLGVPVAYAFLGINILGAYLFLGGEIGIEQLIRSSMASVTTFTLVPISLFLLMGEILFQTGVALKAIDAIDRLITRVPGRLAVVTVVGGTVFSTLSGSSIANTAVLGKVLLPDMLKRRYEASFAMGAIMAVGAIAMLIPPSALAVLLGSLGGISIAKLLLAGVIPGLLISTVFLCYVMVRATINSELAPAYDVKNMTPWERIWPFLVYVLPLFSIFIVVVGSILTGIATPTESAAFGSVASLIIAACYRSLSIANFLKAIEETAKVSVMILFIIVASSTFAQILAISGATQGLLSLVADSGLPRLMVLIGMLSILVFFGMFMDGVSMMLITLPLYIPLATSVGMDLVWFGTLMLIVVEVSLLTPPFGLLLFTMKGVAPPGITLRQIMLGALPYVILEFVVLGFLVAFPEIVLWLPRLA